MRLTSTRRLPPQLTYNARQKTITPPGRKGWGARGDTSVTKDQTSRGVLSPQEEKFLKNAGRPFAPTHTPLVPPSLHGGSKQLGLLISKNSTNSNLRQHDKYLPEQRDTDNTHRSPSELMRASSCRLPRPNYWQDSASPWSPGPNLLADVTRSTGRFGYASVLLIFPGQHSRTSHHSPVPRIYPIQVSRA